MLQFVVEIGELRVVEVEAAHSSKDRKSDRGCWRAAGEARATEKNACRAFTGLRRSGGDARSAGEAGEVDTGGRRSPAGRGCRPT